jgi:glycosyltransferase involved in cell wall biosynthesis
MVSTQDQHEEIHVPSAFLPNVPFSICEDHTPVPNSKNILFVGSLWYQPNADGVDWFLQHVWPQVRAFEPEATLTLAGAASPSARARWETHVGVSAPGFLDDLASTYQRANLIVVPIQSGGGTNIKVLEAMAHARPCLVSSFVAQAFDGLLADDKEMLVARNADEFSAKVVNALRVGTNLQRVADAGHLAIGKYFTHDLFRSRVKDFVQPIVMKSAAQNG